jgi:hypothetical protein
MTGQITGQMCWLAKFGEGQLILHLRENAHQGWRPYTAFPHLRVPDLQIPNASKGWTTFQHLRQAGWILIPTAEAHTYKVEPAPVRP